MKINKKNAVYFLLYFFLLAPFFKPISISTICPQLGKVYSLLKICAFIFAFFYFLRKKRISKFTLTIAISQFFLVLITYYYNGNVTSSFDNLLSIFTICILIESGLEKNPKIFLKSFISLLFLLVSINFITVLLYPNGMYYSDLSIDTARNWFLGNKNNLILYILPLVFLIQLYRKITNQKISVFYMIVLLESIISISYCWSATGVVGLGLFMIGTLFQKKLSSNHFLNFKNYFLSYIILFISFIVLRLQNIFSYFIVDILKRDITFTGRVYIWDFIIESVQKKMLCGYGIEYALTRFLKSTKVHAYHAHNQLLEFLYQGGVIYLGFIIATLVIVYKKMKQNKEHPCYFLIGWTIFCYLMMMLTEYYSFSSFIYIFCIAYHIDLLKE